MRELVAVLYVVGAVITAGGVLMAYRRARRDLRRLQDVADLHESHAEVELADSFEAALSDDDRTVAVRDLRRATRQTELNHAVEQAGIRGGPPKLKDFALPMEYWAKRSALTDAVASFRSGGLVALLGLVISTVASVWSLYLPTG